jgi:carbon-monoxide dehydrogenase small subunit
LTTVVSSAASAHPGRLAAKSLLDSNPSPTEEQVKEWMMGNLCRCTGYYQIMESIMKAIK